ncbi:rod shape-determining protein MreD [Schwartzia succinivorans]|uniref:Rod shape-determining protein MreD n=1 Tax=Schwartzia succinivorans DSM 10502 TaxID=1123243 RepID=A0A1M5AGA0_9FIRM|nr:rod shape-determining protein MreD [Schwartzia succinivorans]MBE6096175.1 rod shape-determining protein MreD [Schwartzia succinivorans]SHF29174.1 rod shape-determining protein MreD [Schwartzia succinivorans DSM 10502]
MTRKYILWALFVLALYVIQSSLMPFISIHGISADLLLLFVVSVSFQKGSRNGSLVGFLSGLLQDLATGTFFGINIFIKMIVGYVCGRFSKQVFKEQFFLMIAAVVFASAFNYVIYASFMFMLGYSFNLLLQFNSVFMPMMFYNVVFSLPVHIGVCKMCERLQEDK